MNTRNDGSTCVLIIFFEKVGSFASTIFSGKHLQQVQKTCKCDTKSERI